MNVFSDEIRRNPYPLYDGCGPTLPCSVCRRRSTGGCSSITTSVKWALNDHEVFSSRVPAPRNWFIFFDPPAHTKLRALISQAFTPRMIADLEPRIRQLSRELLDPVMERGEMDLAAEFSSPASDESDCRNDRHPPCGMGHLQAVERHDLETELYAVREAKRPSAPGSDFTAVTVEMGAYLADIIERGAVSRKMTS